MISLKSKEEIRILKEGGGRLQKILAKVARAARVGVSTQDLDKLAERLIAESGGEPVFKGYRIKGVATPYPASLCTSINDELVHAIPKNDRILKEGDIIGLDIGMRWQGLITDMAVTVGVGKISSEAERLLHLTRDALDIGINEVKPGAQVGDVGYAIERHLKKYGLGVIRDLGGHGVGYELHEEPLIPNYGRSHTGPELKEGMVFAIEPMATLGSWRVVLQDDGWTFKTVDGSLAAHFEHTVAVTRDGARVLTSIS